MLRIAKELGRDAYALFRRGSNLFELTWQASERERGGESGSDKEMSHPRWTLTGSCVFNNGPAGYTDSGTYQPIIPTCTPSSYPSGGSSLITLRTSLSAVRRAA